MTIIFIISRFSLLLLVPVLFCGGFYYGFSTARNVFVHHTVTRENIPAANLFASVGRAVKETLHTETQQERLARIMAENVENYGTDIPQKEVI